MSESIDGRSRELIEQRNFATVATVSADGSPHVAVVWIDMEGDELYVNSSEGRVWPENLRRDARIAVTVMNLENPYEYVTVKGRAELTADGADEHIDALAKKYLDVEEYPYRQPGEVRLKIRVVADKVTLRSG